MAAANYDIIIEQGATFTMELFLRDASSTPINLTDLIFRGSVKKNFQEVSPVATFSFEKLNQALPGEVGKVIVSISATQTAAIQVRNNSTTRTLVPHVYDIESEDSAGIVVRWLQGVAQISPEVTTA